MDRNRIILEPDRLHVKIDPQGDPEKPYVTTRAHTYHDGLITMTVPCGYRTDLTSWIKWLGEGLLVSMLICLFWPPWVYFVVSAALFALILREHAGRSQIAALFHDRAYELGYDKIECDAFYAAIMGYVKEHPVRRALNFAGVFTLGGRAYWNHRKRQKQAKE